MVTTQLTVAFVSNLEDYQNSKTPKANSREIASKAVATACEVIKAKLIKVSCNELVKVQTEAVDTVINSDVLVVDTLKEQSVILYYIGVRESLKLKSNAILYMAEENKIVQSMSTSMDEGQFLLPYVINESGNAVVVDPNYAQLDTGELQNLKSQMIQNLPLLSKKLQIFFQDAKTKTRMHMECKFLKALRKDRELLKGEELCKKVREMRSRLDDPLFLSPDILLNMFLSYKEAAAYDDMIQLFQSVESLKMHSYLLDAPIRYYYAFALNRRNLPGDSEKALKEIKMAIQTCKQPSPDMFGLLGRIYKDKVKESNNTNKEALKLAIESYRQGFIEHQSTYLGVNLATLLLIDGQTMNSMDLQNVCNHLHLFIGRKGNLEDMTDYWDVATFFEVRVISEDYAQAVRAAECMYKLDPPTWSLASTLDNIRLIVKSRKIRPDSDYKNAVHELFDFWMAFFQQTVNEASRKFIDKSKAKLTSSDTLKDDKTAQDNASLENLPSILDDEVTVKEDTEEDESNFRIRFEILVIPSDTSEPTPAVLQINNNIDKPHISMHFIDPRMKNKYCCQDRYRSGTTAGQNAAAVEKHDDWRISMMDPAELLMNATSDLTFYEEDIKGISLNAKSKRSVYFFPVSLSEVYNLVFPSEFSRQEFYSSVRQNVFTDNVNYLLNDKEEAEELLFTYEQTTSGELVILGSGSYGTVYSGYLANWEPVAIKEIKNIPQKDQQTLIEEINLHSRLHHVNIVRYMGCAYEDGIFKIIMERVIGGSLTYMLKKYDPLKIPENTVADYCSQILEGINYLHENKIIHRDIKGDNILVDMYKGVLKIADFGGSKRLSGLLEKAITFAGSMRYMAPELIKPKADGYDYPADIWSFGCTVVEMITGKLPYNEFEDPIAAMFHAATYNKHPKLPDDISDACRDFTLRCFKPAGERATAEQLLNDHFLRSIRKQKQKKSTVKVATPKPSPILNSLSTSEKRNSLQRRSRVNSEDLQKKVHPPFTSVICLKTPPVQRRRDSGLQNAGNLLSPPIRGGHHRHQSLRSPIMGDFDASTSPTRMPPENLFCVTSSFDLTNNTSISNIVSTCSPTSPINGSVHSGRLDNFNIIKCTDHAKTTLANELTKKRESIVTWILERTVKSVRLPSPFSSDLETSYTSSAAVASPLNIMETSMSSSRHLSQVSRESDERDLIELVFDLLVDYLRNGKSLESLQRCLNTCIRKLDVRKNSRSKSQQMHKISSSHSFDGALPECESRCNSLFLRILQPHYRGGGGGGGRQDATVDLLIAFLTTAWSQLLTNVPESLKQSCEQPHKLLTWVKLLKDACTVAMGQLTYSDAPMTPLRRQKTLGGHQRYNYFSRKKTVDNELPPQDSSHPRRRVQLHSPSSPQPSGDSALPNMYDDFEDEEGDMDVEDWEDGASSEFVRNKIGLKRNINSTRYVKRSNPLAQHDTGGANIRIARENFFQELTQVFKSCIETYNDVALTQLQKLFSSSENSLRNSNLSTEPRFDLLNGITSGFNSLPKWLYSLGISMTDIEKITENKFDESDFLQLITKDDLYRIGLCGGSVLRIWKAVSHMRHQFLSENPPSPSNSHTNNGDRYH